MPRFSRCVNRLAVKRNTKGTSRRLSLECAESTRALAHFEPEIRILGQTASSVPKALQPKGLRKEGVEKHTS